MDENKLIRDASRGSQAELLLKNELLVEAFETLEREYIDALIDTGVTQADSYRRDRLHQAIHILRKVRGHLKTVVVNGNVAKADIDNIKGRARAA